VADSNLEDEYEHEEEFRRAPQVSFSRSKERSPQWGRIRTWGGGAFLNPTFIEKPKEDALRTLRKDTAIGAASLVVGSLLIVLVWIESPNWGIYEVLSGAVTGAILVVFGCLRVAWALIAGHRWVDHQMLHDFE